MIHSSKIFIFMLMIFIVGNIISITRFFHVAALIPISIFVLTIIFWRLRKIRIILLIVLAGFLSIWRTDSFRSDYLSNYLEEQKYLNITARVIEEPSIIGRGQKFLIETTELKKLRIEITTTQFPKYNYGDYINISGKVEPVIVEDEYGNYDRLRRVTGNMFYPDISSIDEPSHIKNLVDIRKILIGYRNNIENVLSRILPEPESGLLVGIMLGTKADLNTEIISMLSRTGLTHVIALSGYNITIVAAFASLLSRNLSRHLSFWIPMFGIILFVLATGMSASVVRAALMGIMFLVAKTYGRQSSPLISILFVSAIMIFINPYILVYDIGFQLSFAALIGIIYLGPILEKYLNKMGKLFGPILALTISAQIFTWPLTSYYFGIISVVAPIANIMVLPLIPVIMFLGFTAGILGIFSLWLSQGLSYILWFLLAYIIKIVNIFGTIEWSSFNYRIGDTMIILGYYLLLIDLIILNRGGKLNGRKTILS